MPTIQLRQLVAGMAPMLLLYILYTVIRFLVKDRGPVEGIRNGYEVLHLEQRLGLDWELSLQEVMLPHEWLVKAANWYYVIGFLPVILACASIAAILDFRTFLWWRKRFALTMILALIGFGLFPLAPPRMLPGMVD
ncbi:MAG TPA: phosphatase PAP2 family protein, partial [Thermomicrobiales bacterium]|nr:phosphatase PAP2 family protein [Thermomicrobiales bacterium]